jgi:hypothetical protein
MRSLAKLSVLLLAILAAWSLTANSPQAAPEKSAAHTPAAVAADIDRIIDAKLAEAKLPASPLADDAEFIRRLSLDIRGRIPYAERVAAFLSDTDPNKRAKLIDEFLADPEYGEHFGIMWYHRIVKPDDENRFLIKPQLQEWLAEQFNKSRGWNRIVADLLIASGDRDAHPETIFWLANVGDSKKGQPEPNRVTAAASKLFLGVKLECCECHNHPFTTLKQEDFWGVAAFFAQTHADHATKKEAKAGATPVVHEGGAVKLKKKDKEAGVERAPFGQIVIPDSKGKTVKATFLGGEQPTLSDSSKLRPVFAAWATSAKNPYFARAAANRMWANFFGRGIMEPVDDMRNEAKASHPEVLSLLAGEFVAADFDLKHLIRCICNSKTYQRTSRPLPENKDDDKLYSRMPVKVMSADVLYDSLRAALGHAAADKEKGMGKKKKGGGTARDQFRKFFHAEADDDVGVIEDYTHGIPQALRLMNSQQINDTAGTVAALMKAGDADKVIQGLYLTALSRKPTEAEVKRMKEYVAGEKEAAKAYGDILWVLLNSSEFLLNH